MRDRRQIGGLANLELDARHGLLLLKLVQNGYCLLVWGPT